MIGNLALKPSTSWGTSLDLFSFFLCKMEIIAAVRIK